MKPNVDTELATRIIRYRYDPVAFVREVIGVEEIYDYQAKVLRALASQPRVKIAWRAGRGVGKSSLCAWAVLWHTFLFYESRTVTTASNWRQVERILWPEIHKWESRVDYSRLGFERSSIDVQKIGLIVADQWFARGESSNDPQKLEGFHADHILFIVDEAKLVSRETFHSIEGSLTTSYAKQLVVSTPPRSAKGCYFKDIFQHRVPGYILFHTSGLDSPIVDKKWAKSITDPVEYQTQVLGEFVDDMGDVMRVFDPQKLDEAINRELDDIYPVVMGVDIARAGSDLTVVMVRRGQTIGTRIESWGQQPLTYTEGRIKEIAREENPAVINIDVIGYGAGIYDNMLEEGEFSVEEINFRAKAPDSTRYANMRAFAYADLANKIANGTRSLPNDEKLLRDLSAQVFDIDRLGRKIIVPKELIRKELGYSPDFGDAAVLCSLETEYDDSSGGGFMF